MHPVLNPRLGCVKKSLSCEDPAKSLFLLLLWHSSSFASSSVSLFLIPFTFFHSLSSCFSSLFLLLHCLFSFSLLFSVSLFSLYHLHFCCFFIVLSLLLIYFIIFYLYLDFLLNFFSSPFQGGNKHLCFPSLHGPCTVNISRTVSDGTVLLLKDVLRILRRPDCDKGPLG